MLLWDLEPHSFKELHREGGIRYHARILELKRLGYDIEDDGAEEGKWWRLRSHDLGPPLGKKVKVYLEESDVEQLIDHGVVSRRARLALSLSLSSFKKNRHKL